MPICLHRAAPGEKFCAACRGHRPALHGGASHRSDEFQHWTGNHHRGLSVAGEVMSASDGVKRDLVQKEQAVLSPLHYVRANIVSYFMLFARKPRYACVTSSCLHV